MYGSLTTLILVMFWLYFCNYFIMIGAEINEILRQGRAEEKETSEKEDEKETASEDTGEDIRSELTEETDDRQSAGP